MISFEKMSNSFGQIQNNNKMCSFSALVHKNVIIDNSAELNPKDCVKTRV